ncbi:hypothetical protein GGR51DRAFT_533652 [Nemania sp. FL0031]|nr:hypothetical protein GGR51DRAFT_533652 [Nemania sp. FL0031]
MLCLPSTPHTAMARLPLPPASAFDPPDSNPDDIAILWEQVCPYRTTSTQCSKISSSGERGRANKRVDNGVGEADLTVSGSIISLSTFSKSKIAPGSSVSNTNPVTSMKFPTITTRCPDFSNIILRSCGIYISTKGPIVPDAFTHFGTEKPLQGYSSLEGLSHANVWVEKDSADLKRIAAEYLHMKGLDLCEEEFATRAKEVFLSGPWRSDEVSLDRQWRADRMIQLVCPPDESRAGWLPPPFLDGHGDVRWSWDVRPDCAYWLSLKGINPEYRHQVPSCTFVRKYITCPYFTIEFKRDGQSKNVAENQVAAAGSLALYNRWRLYTDERKANKILAAEDISNIRHYTLTFVGPAFCVWVLQPTIRDGQWNGCTMTSLLAADCIDEYAVEALIDWVNEIHRWGLSKHGPSCERDVKSILKVSGVRTSNIHEESASHIQ